MRVGVRAMVMGAAGAVLVITVACMGASALGLRVKLDTGCLSVSAYGPVQADGARYGTTAQAGWWWPPNGFTDRDRGGWGVVLPLWMPCALAAGALGGAWLHGRRRRRWARQGLCVGCGYDVAGIEGPCPECGGEKWQMGK